MEENAVYKKVGRRYEPIGRCDTDWLGEGIWLVYQNKFSKSTHNINYRVDKIGDIESINIPKFCKYISLQDEIARIISENNGRTAYDLAGEITNLLYKKDEESQEYKK